MKRHTPLMIIIVLLASYVALTVHQVVDGAVTSVISA